MTAKELAAKLHGCEYLAEIDAETEAAAKAAGLVVVFGASDDLIEFRGAINDECYADEDGAFVDAKGRLRGWLEVLHDGDKDEIRDYLNRERSAKKIAPLWCQEADYSFTYQTEIPHETFDVMEDDGKYCRGIVFSIADL